VSTLTHRFSQALQFIDDHMQTAIQSLLLNINV